MRDRRDFLILALAIGLVFCLGVAVGKQGSLLPQAVAQDGEHKPPEVPDSLKDVLEQMPGGGEVPLRPGLEARTTPATGSDSNSNNRFVAVTCPIGSGESVLFVLDSLSDQLAVYQYERRKGLKFLSGRKIDFDLRIHGYRDESDYTRDEMRALYERERARAAAAAAKSTKSK
jgi:hypothetical protein